MGHTERAIKIVEISEVEPTHNTVTITSPKTLPLTFFDLLWLRSPPVKRVYFFNTRSSDVIPRLKRSLSLALRHFLPLAGNLVWPESSTVPFVQYDDGDGVSFSVADSGPEIDYRVVSGDDVAFEAEAYHALVPDLEVSGEKAAVLAVQVTVFPGNGVSIGVALHHAVLDGRSVHMFVKTWAHVCRTLDSEGFSSSLPEEITPSYNRSAIHDNLRLAEIYAENWMSFDGPKNRSLTPMIHQLLPNMVRKTFTLTRQDTENIKLMISDNPQMTRVSTFSLACAYVWACLVKSEEGSEDSTDDQKAIFAIPCDFRARLKSPLPENYFGNCITGTSAEAKVKYLTGDLREGLGSALKEIVKAIKSFDDGEEMLKGAEEWVLKWATFSPVIAGNKFCSVAGSPRFEAYGADFGWGRPVKTDVVSIDSTKAILLQDAKDGNGIEFGLALKKAHMEAFASLIRQGLSSYS